MLTWVIRPSGISPGTSTPQPPSPLEPDVRVCRMSALIKPRPKSTSMLSEAAKVPSKENWSSLATWPDFANWVTWDPTSPRSKMPFVVPLVLVSSTETIPWGISWPKSTACQPAVAPATFIRSTLLPWGPFPPLLASEEARSKRRFSLSLTFQSKFKPTESRVSLVPIARFWKKKSLPPETSSANITGAATTALPSYST